ncbi:MAG: DUF6599 family protein [Candidatus Aminicenantales bacterium]
MKDFGPQIPRRIQEWKATGNDSVFDRKTLYDYMDGGAEVYLAFDYREVFVRRFADSGENEIVLDIYDMGSPAEAYGIFSCDREDPPAGIGQGSEYGLGLLRFWRGRYFVSITVSGNEEKAEKAVLELGKAVAPILGPDGSFPGMLDLLPQDGLQADKTSYFHNHIHLSNRYFVSAENILNLDEKTECVFAEYASKSGDSGRLLVVRYPDAADAQTAFASFLKSFLPEADADGAAPTENKNWTMIKTRDNLVAVVFEASSKEYAGRLAGTVIPPAK